MDVQNLGTSLKKIKQLTLVKLLFETYFYNVLRNTFGSIIYNKSNMVHAMRVNEVPFLSIWCWPYNSSKKCVLVPRKDWIELA